MSSFLQALCGRQQRAGRGEKNRSLPQITFLSHKHISRSLLPPRIWLVPRGDGFTPPQALLLIPYNLVIFYMYFANYIANPFIYAFMNQNFRDDLHKILFRK